jgi:hypothetical protein
VYAIRIDQAFIRLNTFDTPKLREAVKEQPIAAAHVENAKTATRPEVTADHAENCFLPRPPPPMTRV